MRIGTAIGSNDVALIPAIKDLKFRKLVDYVELYIQPDATIANLLKWRKSGLVSICHIPHGARAEFVPEYVDIGIWGAKFFDPYIIIYDAGINTVQKTHTLPLNFIVENMPDVTSYGDPGVLYDPEQMNTDFCLDFAHAWITATHKQLDPRDYIDRFMMKRPKHFHLTDVLGDRDHVLLGRGTIDLEYIVKKLKHHDTVTIETDHELPDRLQNITSDLLTLNKLL